MTEQDYDAIMKKVGATYASMRKNLDSGEVTGAAKDPQQLAELFGEAEKFWAQHKKQDAVKWSQMARTYATEIADALTAAEGFLKLDARIQRATQASIDKGAHHGHQLGRHVQAVPRHVSRRERGHRVPHQASRTCPLVRNSWNLWNLWNFWNPWNPWNP